jgi:AraC-like DNA-binding protein
MVTWEAQVSWKNLLTEGGSSNNRKIIDSIRPIRQTAHPIHHGSESATAQLLGISRSHDNLNGKNGVYG